MVYDTGSCSAPEPIATAGLDKRIDRGASCLDIIQDKPFPLHRTTLPNGLQVWSQPRPVAVSVATLLVIHAGSQYEDRANDGISHYVEHMPFTSTERWSEEQSKDIITNRGGRWNGTTGLERATYFAHVAAEKIDIALDRLAEVAFQPRFPEEKVDKEREGILQER